MSKLPLKSSSLIVLSLASAWATDARANDDWRCDRPAHLYPPVGCALWGPTQTKGMCTSFYATINWHCLGPWAPASHGGYSDHDQALKSLTTLSLPLPTEFALLAPHDNGRSLRLAVDTKMLAANAGRVLPVLELQTMDAKRRGTALQIERDGHGGYELVVRALGEQRPQARLALTSGRSSVLLDWRNDEFNGPQLTVSSGLQSVAVGLPKLDAETRLQLWQLHGAELHFDVSARRSETVEDEVKPDLDHPMR